MSEIFFSSAILTREIFTKLRRFLFICIFNVFQPTLLKSERQFYCIHCDCQLSSHRTQMIRHSRSHHQDDLKAQNITKNIDILKLKTQQKTSVTLYCLKKQTQSSSHDDITEEIASSLPVPSLPPTDKEDHHTTVREARLTKRAEYRLLAQLSYMITLAVVKAGFPSTAGQLVLEVLTAFSNALDLTYKGKPASEMVLKIPLSEDTMRRCTQRMAEDCCDQVACDARTTSYKHGLEFDETTSKNKSSCLVGFIHYSNKVEPLFCKLMPAHVTGNAIFQKIEETYAERELDLGELEVVCVDGCSTNLGKHNGACTLLKQNYNELLEVHHCAAHRFSLATKLNSEFQNTLDKLAAVANYFKKNSLKARLFKLEAHQSGMLHTSLKYYCKVRWLSASDFLCRLVELEPVVQKMLEQDKSEKAKAKFQYLNRVEVQLYLGFLCDLCNLLQPVFRQLQMSQISLSEVNNLIATIKQKLQLLHLNLQQYNFDLMPVLFAKRKLYGEAVYMLERNRFMRQIQSIQFSLNERFTEEEFSSTIDSGPWTTVRSECSFSKLKRLYGDHRQSIKDPGPYIILQETSKVPRFDIILARYHSRIKPARKSKSSVEYPINTKRLRAETDDLVVEPQKSSEAQHSSRQSEKSYTESAIHETFVQRQVLKKEVIVEHENRDENRVESDCENLSDFDNNEDLDYNVLGSEELELELEFENFTETVKN